MNLWLISASISLIPFYFFRFSIWGIPTNIFELVVALTLVMHLYHFWQKRQKIHWGPLWPYVLLLAALLAVFTASDRETALGILKGWFVVPWLLYWLIINSKLDNTGLRVIFYALYVPLLVISLWAIGQRVDLVPLLFYQVNDASFLQYQQVAVPRVFGPFESPNYLAMYIVPILAIVVGLRTTWSKSKSDILFIASLALPIIALLLSLSKGGILALGAVVLLCIVCYISRKPTRYRLIGLGVVALAVALVLSMIYNQLQPSDNWQLRTEIYSYSWLLVREHILLGIGLGGYHLALSSLELTPSFMRYVLPYALHPHNLFLALWLNLGLLGLVPFLVGIAWLFKRLWVGASTLQIALAGALLAILVHGLVDTTYFKNDLSAIFWLIVALTYLITNHERR